MPSRPRSPATPPTLADVARRAGVSRQTVSNAINNPDLLRSETLARVRSAIDALGYLPNRAARHLRTGHSRSVGLRLPPVPEQTANTAMIRFERALVDAARDGGYHLLLVADGAREDAEGNHVSDPIKGYDDLLRSTAVDAFIVTDTYVHESQTTWLDGQRVPVVAFGRPWADLAAGREPGHSWVDVDGAAGVRAATEHLLSLGHRRIAWLGWAADSWLGEDRRRGWVDAMAAAGRPSEGLERRTADTVDAGRDAARELLDAAQPSAFVCASDTLAVAVLHVLAERDLRPGQDVAVVGFDDSVVAQIAPPGITSVRAPLEEVAVAIIEALQQMTAGSQEHTGVLLTPTLRVRGTTVSGG